MTCSKATTDDAPDEDRTGDPLAQRPMRYRLKESDARPTGVQLFIFIFHFFHNFSFFTTLKISVYCTDKFSKWKRINPGAAELKGSRFYFYFFIFFFFKSSKSAFSVNSNRKKEVLRNVDPCSIKQKQKKIHSTGKTRKVNVGAFNFKPTFNIFGSFGLY